MNYEGDIVSIDSKLESAIKSEIIFTKDAPDLKLAEAQKYADANKK